MVNKTAVIASAIVALLTLSLVFAETTKESIEKEIEKILDKNVSNITEVDQASDEINIKNATLDNNIAIYRADIDKGERVFVITFSNKGFQTFSQIYYATSFLSFGLGDERNASSFMKLSSGVEGSLDRGYVMVRSGSITGISTSLDVTQPDDSGSIKILIYKNGELVGLGNMLEVSSSGTKKDYDIQSLDIVNFSPGDAISLYLDSEGSASFRDVTAIVEISTTMN
jgi:hypothetical protein